MRIRFTLALCSLFAFAMPALAEPPKPTVVVQAASVSRLLTEYREMIRQVAGPAEGDRMVKKFESEIKDVLGEQGFEGVDVNRPFAAYSVVREKFEETNLIVVVPVTGEKEFLAFLERLKMKAEPVKDKKGLYKLEPVGLNRLPNASHVRFTEDGWAYVGLNGDEVADAKNLIPPGDLLDNVGPSLASAKLFPGRFPEKVLKGWLDDLDNMANGVKGFAAATGPKHVIRMLVALFEEGPKLIRRYAETGLKEAAEVGLRFGWDPMTGETITELILTPKPGTPLAKDVAAKPAIVNRFAGLVPPNAAVGAVIKAPLFAKELREIVVALLEAGQVELKTGDLPESFRPVVDELARGLIQNVRKGDLDGAVALLGPDKDGKFTVVGAVSFDDATALEKVLRQAAKPADLAKHFEFDVAKVGEVSIHKVPLARAANEEILQELSKVFGQKPTGYVAFTRDAAYVSFGPDALAAIKTALAAKPGPAPVVEVTGNMRRLHKLIAAIAGEEGAGTFAKNVGTDDKSASMLRVTVEGGETLKVKATVNVRYLPRFLLLSESQPAVGK